MKITTVETLYDLSNEEIAKRAQLTPAEKKAVDNFIRAARALPDSICAEIDGSWAEDESEPTLTVSKRITAGSAQVVAKLRKPSLAF